jgi:ribosomal protein L37AE/L43A
MNIELFRHWIPDLRQTKNKSAYVAKQCPVCPRTPHSKSFRINTKLKVWKCYQCGRSGKSFNKMIHYLKKRDTKRKELQYWKKIGRRPVCVPIDVHYGCETYYQSTLPF